jgi:alpha-N-arabinofuranosidase
MFRYPGGCFSDWYHWRDGVGPAGARPVHETQFWTSFNIGDPRVDPLAPEFGPREDNQFGTDEFLRYCVDGEIEPLLVANAGTGTPEEAAEWVRYVNRGAGPRAARWWGVGNEIYGVWELGHCPPEEYAERYLAYRAAMRAVDPEIRLVAVGCGDGTEAAARWNETVLSRCARDLEALSVHWYFPGTAIGRALRDDEADYLQVAGAPELLGRMLDEVIGIADRAAPGANVQLALDEWNLWVLWEDLLTTNHRLCDAVFFAGCWNQLLQRADRVSHAMISHQVNCMAPIQTRGDRMFVTSSYLVMQMYRRHVRAQTLPISVGADRLRVPPFSDAGRGGRPFAGGEHAELGGVPVLSAAATADDAGATLFLTNRSLAEPLSVEIGGLDGGREGTLRLLRGPDPFSRNDVDQPALLGFAVSSVETDGTGGLRLELPPATTGCLLLETRA